MHRFLGCVIALLVLAAPAAAEPMRLDPRDTGFDAGEPTLGALRDGSIVFQAMTKTIRSTDDGQSWTELHDVAPLGLTLDPYVHVDPQTDRIIASQLYGACQLISLSDDKGATWVDHATQCGTGDHQKLGSGPWPSGALPPSAVRHPSATYTCVNHVADTACATSFDGGLTWGPLVTAFAGVDPSADQGVNGVRGLCGGLLGDPAVAPDGTVYVPKEHCGRPFVAVSRDAGVTWTTHRVGEPDSQARPIAFGANNPSVAIAADGDVYYAWTDGQFRHRIARSGDRGATWGASTVVSAPGASSTTFPFVIAGADGRVATGYIAATGGIPGNPGSVGADAVWHLHVATSLNADAAQPTYEDAQVTPDDDPIMRGCVGRHGGSCSANTLLDFNDVTFLPDGRLAVSYVDACLPEVCTAPASSRDDRGYVAVQTGGPLLR